jgi:two-component system, OmpR family, sensor histidine kinase CpxA
MKGARSWPLSRKILGLALLNLLLMAAILAAFAQWQFGLSVESMVLGPARDRILAIANAFGRDLDGTPYASRGALLVAYSRRYGAEFYLVSPEGDSIAGQDVALPGALLERVRGGGPPDRAELVDRNGPGRGFPPPEGPGFGPQDGPPSERAFVALTRNPLQYWIGVRIPTNGREGERGVPGVLLLRADSIFNSQLFFDWRSLLWLAAALAGAALLCWWPFVRGVTRSIRQMDIATEQIAQGGFQSHVTAERRDELGHLGAQINRMAERLEAFVKHQKRFLGDIAHELSAPLARIQFALGILEQRVEQPQRPHVDVLREEIQEMSELVNELLMFSKAGMQPAATPLKRVDLSPVVARAISHQVLGSGAIQVAIDPALAVFAHEPYLLRAISNLLRNGLRYAGEEGPIMVAARREGSRVLLTVTDCGPGLPKESLERVFEPFYRPETARSRDTGGAGLGLAIVKSCIEACGGTVACRNREPSGLEVAISLEAGE